MEGSTRLTQQALGLTAGMNALVCLDTAFVAGQMMLVRGWETGMNLYVVEPSANPFREIPQALSIDFVALVPYQLERILASNEAAHFNHIKMALIGGAPLEATTVEKLSHFSCRFFATYGMTETLTHIALRPLNGPQASDRFRALPGIRIETDSRNCLVIHAPHLGEAIITNDVVQIFPEGEFEWIGRWDHVINSGGVKIHPEQVESKLDTLFREHGLTHRFFIASQPHPSLHQQVVLVIEGAPDPVVQLWPQIRSVLNRYESPKQVLVTPHFAETASGKVDRSTTLKSNPQPLPLPEEV
jgi:O-succinylbenzoic acid--CoA ligase